MLLVRENEKKKRIALEGVVTRLEQEKGSLTTQVDELGVQNTKLDKDLTKQKKLVDSYKTKLRRQENEAKQQRERAKPSSPRE